VKLRIAIVDDERIARQRLRRLLAREAETEIVAECASALEALAVVAADSPDLLLLDIQMPGANGFDVVEALGPAPRPGIVFVTAFDQHAVHAFETCAIDYLLKPVAPERLSKALARTRARLPQTHTQITTPREVIRREERRFFVRSGAQTAFIAINEIDWIEACGNYAILHVGQRNHFLRETMSTLETLLPSDEFLRVSRSAILHLDRVEEVHIVGGGHHIALLKDGQRVNFTRSVREVISRVRGVQDRHSSRYSQPI
jgi:two-component system LytT family response regulator